MAVHNPHDKFFKSWFSQPVNLIPLLQASLPADVFALMDTGSLVVSSDTFVDLENREHFSDLSANIRVNGLDARIYILVEHKSYNDQWALLQILRYMVQTWTRDSRAKPARPLLPILPILFYHGESKVIVTEFTGLFATGYPEILKRYRPEFQCGIFNLTAMPDESLQGPPQFEAALWAMKYARTQVKLVLKALNRLARTLGSVMRDNPAFHEIEMYILSSSDRTPEELVDMINRLLTDIWLKEDMMSTAEMLIARGEARGKAEGKAEGKTEGKTEGKMEEKLDIARRLKEFGMPVAQIRQATGLDEKEIAGL